MKPTGITFQHLKIQQAFLNRSSSTQYHIATLNLGRSLARLNTQLQPWPKPCLKQSTSTFHLGTEIVNSQNAPKGFTLKLTCDLEARGCSRLKLECQRHRNQSSIFILFFYFTNVVPNSKHLRTQPFRQGHAKIQYLYLCDKGLHICKDLYSCKVFTQLL